MLLFDPESVLAHEASMVLDPIFLGAVHLEMTEELGPAGAQLALLQIGFLHGLRDAFRVVDAAFGGGPAPGGVPFVPTLPIQLEHGPAPAQGALELRGVWPDRREAEARLVHGSAWEGDSCAVSEGYTSGWLSGTLDADLLALESGCASHGEVGCAFVAREPEVWRERADPRACQVLDALPFASLRQIARTALGPPERPLPDASSYDGEAAVVHIWGPVMVIPFTSPDEAMRALELIGSDPSAREVSVVIVDLAGVVLDDAFGAATLERVVETAEAWGAETLIAGVSPLSEGVLAELERPPLAVHKELPGAIAAAFQIARAQRAPA